MGIKCIVTSFLSFAFRVGNPMIIWISHGYPKYFGFPMVFWISHEYADFLDPWISKNIFDSSGNQWISVVIHGNLWKSMEIHGYPWISMKYA